MRHVLRLALRHSTGQPETGYGQESPWSDAPEAQAFWVRHTPSMASWPRDSIGKEERMARTPMLTRDRVPAQWRAAFDDETATSGGVIATGPGSVMINSPEMRRRANHLANYLRNESTLPKKIQELAMLTTARAMDCQFIWNAHAARGRRA